MEYPPRQRRSALSTGVVRLFVGLDLPDALKEAVAELQLGLPGARWMGAEGLHLTLAFIGEVDGSARRRIADALAPVQASPLGISLHGLGHFPPRGPLRVLWTGASPARALGSLSRGVRRALADAASRASDGSSPLTSPSPAFVIHPRPRRSKPISRPIPCFARPQCPSLPFACTRAGSAPRGRVTPSRRSSPWTVIPVSAPDP